MNTSTRRHFARHIDPLIAARERRQALARDKARREVAPTDPARAAFDKAIGELARKAEIEYEGPGRRPRATVPAPGFRGVTFEVALHHDSDHSFADLMGCSIEPIEPDSEGGSLASSAPWSPKRAAAHARARSDRESGRRWRGSRHGSASDAAGDLDVSEVLKGHYEWFRSKSVGGLSHHEAWERAKALTLDAADSYREDARRWRNDDLTAVGVEVIARGPDGHKIGNDSLWGIDYRATAESLDYLAHVAAECADTVIRTLPGALSTRVEELRQIVAQYETAGRDAS